MMHVNLGCPAQKLIFLCMCCVLFRTLFIQSKPNHLVVPRSAAGGAGCCHSLREPPLCPLFKLRRSLIFKGRLYCILTQTRCSCNSSSRNMRGIRRGFGARCQVPHVVLTIEVDLKLANACLREYIAVHGCDLHLLRM